MNTWGILTDTISRLASRGKDFNRRTRTIRRRLAVFFAVVGPGPDHLQRGQRRRRNRRVHHLRRAIRLRAVVVAHSHDHRALRQRRNVRPHGRGHRQGAFRPDPRGVRFPLHVFRDDRRVLRGPQQHRRGICRRRGFDADLPHQQIRFGAAGGHRRLDSRRARQLSPGRKNISRRLRVLSHLRGFGFSRKAGLARRCQGNRRAQRSHERAVPADADRSDRHHDCPLAIFLYAGGLRRKAHWAAPIQARAHGCSRRQHLVHGDRVFHYRLPARPR